MSTSPIRFVIIAALAVAGILVIGNAFQGGSAPAAAPAASATSPTKSPKPEKTKTKAPKPTDTATPGTVDGVRIQVFNATSTAGLAAQVESKLTKNNAIAAGTAGNVDANQATSTVYYRDAKADKTNAEYVARRYLGGADVKPISDLPGVSEPVPKDVQVAIVVGEDYQA